MGITVSNTNTIEEIQKKRQKRKIKIYPKEQTQIVIVKHVENKAEITEIIQQPNYKNIQSIREKKSQVH